MKIAVIKQVPCRVPVTFLQTWCRRMLTLYLRDQKQTQHLKIVPAIKMNVVFQSRAMIQRLNKTYRGKNRPTDVLSFSSLEPGSLGELVLCPQIVAKQALEHHLTYQEELGYLVLHGFLHLLGYDHEQSPSQSRQMMRIQDDLFDRLCRLNETAKPRKKPKLKRKTKPMLKPI